MRTFDHRQDLVVSVNGALIYTESTGTPSAEGAPAVVLLHGGFGTLEDFNGLLPALEGREVIGIDSRGHGASTLGDRPWTYQQAQEDVEAVLQALGVHKCSLIGFSDGGTVALRLAAARRVPIDRIVLIGATWHNKNVEATRDIFEKASLSDAVELRERLKTAQLLNIPGAGHEAHRDGQVVFEPALRAFVSDRAGPTAR